MTRFLFSVYSEFYNDQGTSISGSGPSGAGVMWTLLILKVVRSNPGGALESRAPTWTLTN